MLENLRLKKDCSSAMRSIVKHVRAIGVAELERHEAAGALLAKASAAFKAEFEPAPVTKGDSVGSKNS